MKITKFALLLLLSYNWVGCKPQNTISQQETNTAAIPTLKSVDVRGEKLHYVEKGKGEPVLFIHGSISDYRSFLPRVEPYSEDYHVVTYSRRYAWPNRQEYDETVDYSVSIHADDLYALIKELNLGKVHLVCHSYGAFTALTMALEHPEVVKSLVLGEPPAASLAKNTEKGLASWQGFLEDDLRPAKQDFQADKDEEALEHFLLGIFGGDFQLAQVPQVVKQGWMDNLLEIWGIALKEDFPPLDPIAIQSLKVPVLLIVGDRSPTYLIEISNELHRLLPESQMVTLDNSSHGLYFDNPKGADDAVLKFLSEN